jgi:alginate O-acetyltransferase complex protein AlgI
MIFPTLNFLLFYSVLWPLSWGLVLAGRHNLHKLAVIAASYFFYAMWSWKLTFLLFASVLLNWWVGRLIGTAPTQAGRRAAVTTGVAINLSVLGFFKYYGWFSNELNSLLTALNVGRELPLLEIVLPIGISFYTFQGISYVVDLYRGDLDRPRPLIDVMFFISFFPHLVAGPIVRAARFLPQLETPPDPQSHGAVDLLAAVYGYAIQIYCDFSAYSDIAIGVAALLGYRFQRNFNQPYRAGSLAEFWRRWHMSLSSWLRDYLYIPLGGNRHGKTRTRINLMITMVLGGIWHGAAWKFVIWGALHGGMLALERIVLGEPDARATRNGHGIWRRALSIVFTFHFVCLCWIFFRAESLEQAIAFIAGFGSWAEPVQRLTPFVASLIAFGIAIQFTPSDMLQRLDRLYHRIPPWLIGILTGIILLIIEAGSGGAGAPFIYFQF